MKRRILLFLFVYEPLAEIAYTLLRWADNKRKGKVVSEFWTYMWVMVLYGEVNGYVPLGDIDREWRDGTWFEHRGKHPGYLGAVKERKYSNE